MACKAPDTEVVAVAVNDFPQGYRYPATVRSEVGERKLADYRLAADYLNANQFDAVCVQHEYGIFGGDAGSYILVLLRELEVPVVTALHTVLKEPNEEQRITLTELGRLSERVVVMSERAGTFLREIYGVPESKIVLIPHGAPDVPFAGTEHHKQRFGLVGRKAILTFGLLSPGKGIEDMIAALPRIVEKHPDVLLIVLGVTHPRVARVFGEEYRLGLQRQAVERGVGEHVRFENRFVELDELSAFLGAADVCAMPYVNEAHTVSGTLAYAMGTGRAIVSTRFWYAEEMLAEGRGRLVPFGSPEDVACQCIDLFDNESEREAMRKRVYDFSRNMVWNEVAREYLRVFAEAKEDFQNVSGAAGRSRSLGSDDEELPEINLGHLRTMTDDVGMIEHAKFAVPDRARGYCTDDNARALVSAVMAARFLPQDQSLDMLTGQYLSFLRHAFNEQNGRFRNAMTYDRRWTERRGPEDSHARAMWALGVTASFSENRGQVGLSVELFGQGLRAVEGFGSPRAWAFLILGLGHYTNAYDDPEARRMLGILANRLYSQFKEHASGEWPWPERILSYANPRLPQGLILAGRALRRPEMTEMGLRSLEWLARIQTGEDGCFSPVGTKGWYRKGGKKARFDQQPIEAQSMVEACVEALRATGDERWLKEARRCFEWFLGRNDLRVALYDHTTGGCRDGLHPDRANENQGAESTLAWLLSLLTMYEYQREAILLEGKSAGSQRR
jgi:glycosyltransferase involved in cell wall biosynthesis